MIELLDIKPQYVDSPEPSLRELIRHYYASHGFIGKQLDLACKCYVNSWKVAFDAEVKK